jgi:valyl-tRNA synthetase
MNECVRDPELSPRNARETLNRWIAHETARAGREVTAAIEAYRFNDAAAVIYRFVWNVFCDWYLELAKPVLTGPDGVAKTETRAMTAWALDEILKLLHPFMPFITEELRAVGRAEAFGSGRGEACLAPADMLVLAAWPEHDGLDDTEAEGEIGWVVDLVSAIRSVRAEMNVPPATLMPLLLTNATAAARARAGRWAEFIKRLARLSEIGFVDAVPDGSLQLVVRGEIAALPLNGVIDLGAEKARLQKEIHKVESDIKRADAKLGNADFLARAPEEVVESEREKREEAASRRDKILEALERLQGAA